MLRKIAAKKLAVGVSGLHPDQMARMARDMPMRSFYKTPEFAGAAAAAAIPFALMEGTRAIKGLVNSRRKSKVFKQTMEANPRLKQLDSKATQRYFNTLYRVNPEMAKDPTIAASFIHNQHELSDATFPDRGIIAGANEMAKMRESLGKARSTESSGRVQTHAMAAGRLGQATFEGVARGRSDAAERAYISGRALAGDVPAMSDLRPSFGRGGGGRDRDPRNRR